jgi:CRP-like cAMP-binding protein
MNADSTNYILASISQSDRSILEQDLEPIDLPLRYHLANRRQRIEHVYFIDKGVASVVADGTGQPIEIGVIGRDGLTPVTVVMGSERSEHDVFMQAPGNGRRIRADILRAADEKSITLHRVLMRFAHSFFIQVSQTAVANGRSKIDERLARWLLLSVDRVGGDNVPMTHEFLSLMLGNPRPSVTLAVQQLVAANLIQQNRGNIVILDRDGLKERAKGIYTPLSE